MTRNMSSLIFTTTTQSREQHALARHDQAALVPSHDSVAAISAIGMHFLMIAFSAHQITTTHPTPTDLAGAAVLVFVLPFIVGQAVRDCRHAYATPERR